MSSDTGNQIPKVSIGVPVFNGARFIRKSLDSLLGQTFENFEIIISDNASNDFTPKICQEYVQKDARIRYIHHKKNRGATWNFNYVLDQARYGYFMWAAVDDYWSPEFIELNVKALEEEKSLVGSISKMEIYDLKEKNSVDDKFKNFRNRILEILRPGTDISLRGNYDRKVRLLLKKTAYRVIYSIFKTDVLRKSMIKENFVGPDVAIVLNILKHGDINLTNQVLMYKYKGGESTQGSISLAKKFNQNKLGTIFPHYPLTLWFIRNLGWRIFLKNIDHFIRLNLGGGFLVLIDIFKILIKKIF